MTALKEVRWFSLLWVLLLIHSGVSAVTHRGNGVDLANDLRTVIILSGYPCSSVTEFSQPTPSDYHVSCETDTFYRVRINEEKELVVDSLSNPSAAASPDTMNHEKFVLKQLFSIVNLAGHDCAAVLSYERIGPRDNIVTCEGQTVYRIRVTPGGRVTVERQPVDK